MYSGKALVIMNPKLFQMRQVQAGQKGQLISPFKAILGHM